MFKELLKREDIINFITDLYNKDVYHNKVNADQYDLIGIFYDALFKYSIIVDNIMYFDSYFGELKYLFKKLDKLDDINTTRIYTLISCESQLDILDKVEKSLEAV